MEDWKKILGVINCRWISLHSHFNTQSADNFRGLIYHAHWSELLDYRCWGSWNLPGVAKDWHMRLTARDLRGPSIAKSIHDRYSVNGSIAFEGSSHCADNQKPERTQCLQIMDKERRAWDKRTNDIHVRFSDDHNADKEICNETRRTNLYIGIHSAQQTDLFGLSSMWRILWILNWHHFRQPSLLYVSGRTGPVPSHLDVSVFVIYLDGRFSPVITLIPCHAPKLDVLLPISAKENLEAAHVFAVHVIIEGHTSGAHHART